VRYWREEPLEVDGVLEGSWGAWALEVKTGRYTAQDLRGLMEFCQRHPGFRPLAVTSNGQEGTAREAGSPAVSWRGFLPVGPPR
jgi:hypothetical protein